MKETINNQQNTKLVKVIVDSQKPEKGQSLDSGGLRDNKTGRIISQYKNPQVYHQQPVISHISAQEKIQQEKRRQFQYDTELYLADIARERIVNDVLIPVAHTALSKVGTFLTNIINGNTYLYMDRYSAKHDNATIQKDTVNDKRTNDDKIIHFPEERIG